MTTFDTAAASLRDLISNIESHIEQVTEEGDLKKILVSFYHLKNGYEEIDTLRKRIYALKDKMDKAIVPEVLEKSGLDKVAVPELERSFYTLDKYSASIIDKDAGFNWLRDNDAGALITETVNAGMLASFLKDYQLEQGREPPEKIFKFSTYRTTGMSKYKPK